MIIPSIGKRIWIWLKGRGSVSADLGARQAPNNMLPLSCKPNVRIGFNQWFYSNSAHQIGSKWMMNNVVGSSIIN